MGTKENIGVLLTGIQQGSSPYLQAAYQFRLAELERKNRLADLLAEKRQTGIDKGTYIPAPKVQIGTTTDKLSLLPGMQDKTGLMPSYASNIQPQATFRLGGQGYMPKPVRTKWEPTTKEEKIAYEKEIRGIKTADEPWKPKTKAEQIAWKKEQEKIKTQKGGITETSAQSQAYKEAKDEADLIFSIAGFVPEDRKTEYQSYLNKRKQEIYQEKMGGRGEKTVKDIQGDLGNPGRNKAIKFLEDNNAPITDANIEAVKKKYRW